MSEPLVVIDADVLGRQRTGDESYVAEPAAASCPRVADGLRLAAVTRRPDLVPDGVEASGSTRAASRCGWRCGCRSCCGGCGRALAHFLHVVPPALARPVGA